MKTDSKNTENIENTEKTKKTKMSKNIKKKTVIILFVLLAILIIVGAAGLCLLKLYRNDRDMTASAERDIIPGIICIGDSLTHGTGGENISYPYYLSVDMEKDGYIIPVYNLGVGGENSCTIAGRMGAIPIKTDEFVIPKDTEPVRITFEDYKGCGITPLRQGSENNNGVNPCIINGVEGTVSVNQTDVGSDDYGYFFTRNEAGEEISVAAGSEVETYASGAYRDGIYIIFIGTNGGYEDIQDLIYQQQSIIDMQEMNRDKYLIIGMTKGSYDEMHELEEAMCNIYGDKFINLRELLCDEDILTGAGVEVTEADRLQMEEGMVPDCIRTDDTHYTATGYKLLEEAIYDRMKELGYFDELDIPADEFNDKWQAVHKLEIELR